MSTTSEWKPIEIEELNVLIEKAINKMSETQRQFWTKISIAPIKWKEKDFGEKGNGFWAIGVYENKIIWYNDIEEGFNVSTFKISGIINEYGTEQDELQWAVNKIKNEP